MLSQRFWIKKWNVYTTLQVWRLPVGGNSAAVEVSDAPAKGAAYKPTVSSLGYAYKPTVSSLWYAYKPTVSSLGYAYKPCLLYTSDAADE